MKFKNIESQRDFRKNFWHDPSPWKETHILLSHWMLKKKFGMTRLLERLSRIYYSKLDLGPKKVTKGHILKISRWRRKVLKFHNSRVNWNKGHKCPAFPFRIPNLIAPAGMYMSYTHTRKLILVRFSPQRKLAILPDAWPRVRASRPGIS